MAPVTAVLSPCSAGARLQVAKRTALAAPVPQRCVLPRTQRTRTLVVRAERGSSGSFWSGFIVGGTIMGALGFIFAPQISKALLGEDQRLRLPRFLEDESDPEVTKANLADKIAQLNAAIDDVSAQLKSNDKAKEEATA